MYEHHVVLGIIMILPCEGVRVKRGDYHLSHDLEDTNKIIKTNHINKISSLIDTNRDGWGWGEVITTSSHGLEDTHKIIKTSHQHISIHDKYKLDGVECQGKVITTSPHNIEYINKSI